MSDFTQPNSARSHTLAVPEESPERVLEAAEDAGRSELVREAVTLWQTKLRPRLIEYPHPFFETPCLRSPTRSRRRYGNITAGRHSDGRERKLATHVVSYIAHYGLLPPGTEVDHLCGEPSCCQPDHLRAVSHRMNVLRGISPAAVNAAKIECVRGHAFTEENTYRWTSARTGLTQRRCRACARLQQAGRRATRVRTTIYVTPNDDARRLAAVLETIDEAIVTDRRVEMSVGGRTYPVSQRELVEMQERARKDAEVVAVRDRMHAVLNAAALAPITAAGRRMYWLASGRKYQITEHDLAELTRDGPVLIEA